MNVSTYKSTPKHFSAFHVVENTFNTKYKVLEFLFSGLLIPVPRRRSWTLLSLGSMITKTSVDHVHQSPARSERTAPDAGLVVIAVREQ